MRNTVERTFVWLGNFRRRLIRWERRFGVYRSFFAVAIMLLSARRGATVRRHGENDGVEARGIAPRPRQGDSAGVDVECRYCG